MSGGFSSAAWREAHTPWTYTTARRKTYAARPLSAPRVAVFVAAIEGASPARRLAEVRTLLREAFPKRVSFAWRGDPVDEILGAPIPEREATLKSFFFSLGVGRPTPTRRPIRSPRSSSS